jgi:hypothetical protein
MPRSEYLLMDTHRLTGMLQHIFMIDIHHAATTQQSAPSMHMVG